MIMEAAPLIEPAEIVVTMAQITVRLQSCVCARRMNAGHWHKMASLVHINTNDSFLHVYLPDTLHLVYYRYRYLVYYRYAVLMCGAPKKINHIFNTVHFVERHNVWECLTSNHG